ncbi:MAG: endonuclease/exonuclease/phosphatase family protein [Clostridia bacterium]|nr:endonuclease/exonuclease/phosphatase family protein [Clostridia bacterium]
MKLKVMTYNIQHCLDYRTEKTDKPAIDYDVFAAALKELGADAVGLNEVRNAGTASGYDAQAQILAEKAGYPFYYFAEAIRFKAENPYGNAVLSKLPVISAETFKIPDPEPRGYKGYYETRCVAKVKLDVGMCEPLTILSVHFGLNPDEHENAAKTAEKLIEDRKCVLMGDFNVVPENPVLNGIKERMVDTADFFKEPLLSFPSDNPGRKIDYLFVSPDVKVLCADIPALTYSDHRPYFAEIEI